MDEKIIFNSRDYLSPDANYSNFSIRIPESTTKKLDDLSHKTGRSRNQLIAILVEEALKIVEVR